jgi:hypothetical protein
MISVKNYTCAECGAEVKVEGIYNPLIIRSCQHTDAAIHANLEGTVYSQGGMETKFFKLEEIPEQHRRALLSTKWKTRAVVVDGELQWPYSVWEEYITLWHEVQILVEEMLYGEKPPECSP